MRFSRSLSCLVLLSLGLAFGVPAAGVDVGISGNATRAPIATDAEGRFLFSNVPLRKNAINTSINSSNSSLPTRPRIGR